MDCVQHVPARPWGTPPLDGCACTAQGGLCSWPHVGLTSISSCCTCHPARLQQLHWSASCHCLTCIESAVAPLLPVPPAFIDSDEFLVITDGTPSLPALLADYEDKAGLVLNWRILGSSARLEWCCG